MSQQIQYELDVFVDNGFKSQFEDYIYTFDVKNVQFNLIERRADDNRYSITFRAFSPVDIRTGEHWEIKNEWSH